MLAGEVKRVSMHITGPQHTTHKQMQPCSWSALPCYAAGLAERSGLRLQHTEAASKLKPEHEQAHTSSSNWPLYGFIGVPMYQPCFVHHLADIGTKALHSTTT